MSGYRPASRRPIAEIFRRTARRSVRWCVDHHVNPDHLSYGSIAAAVAAGLCYWQSGRWLWLVIPAAACVYARLWLNMLDGMVALEAGKASRRGELVNDLPDRASDVLIFVGVAHSGWCAAAGGYWAAIAALAVAYVGLFGQALGVGRQFGGVMSKPWRMAAVHVGSWIMLGLHWWGPGRVRYGGLTVLDWTMLVIVLGCVQSIVVRLRAIGRGLRQSEEAGR